MTVSKKDHETINIFDSTTPWQLFTTMQWQLLKPWPQECVLQTYAQLWNVQNKPDANISDYMVCGYDGVYNSHWKLLPPKNTSLHGKYSTEIKREKHSKRMSTSMADLHYRGDFQRILISSLCFCVLCKFSSMNTHLFCN
jgi:hypothetical protein